MKNFIRKAKQRTRTLWKKFSNNILPGKKAGVGATIGIFAGFSIATLAFMLTYLSSLGWVVITLMSLGLLIASLGMAVLTVALLRLLNKIPFWLMVSLLIGWPVLMMYFHTTMPGTLMVFLIIATISAMLGGALWLMKKRWGRSNTLRRSLIISNFSIGLLLLIGLLYWMVQPGKLMEMPVNASMSVPENLPPQLALDNPGIPGQYKVSFLSYGSGEDKHRNEFGEDADLITQPVDGSTFLDSWNGMSGKMRTSYFGFDQKNLPLNARVWYPEGEGPFPLVLVVHGNHLAQDFSDPGYAYLGELLASRGYILASVDENFLNGSYSDLFSSLENENNVRGWLMLKHLQVWDEWTAEPDNMFFQKVDMENIALIGHSRGGEAVAHAALFNRLPFYPDNAMETFDFNFHIRSVIAIAPSDGQYQPSSIRTPLTDINYFTLQGSHDADVSSYQALRQFNRIDFSDDFDGFKAGLYIYFANHGQFNTVWGRKDYGAPRINFFNLKQLIPEEDQQQIALVYISGFLEATLRGAKEYRPMFMDHRTARNWLPQTIYLNQYEQSGTQYVGHFNEDLDLSTASLPGSFIEAHDLSIWREKKLPLNWGDYDTRGLVVGWNTENNDTLQPCYHMMWAPEHITTSNNSILVFSMAETGGKADPPKDKNDNGNKDVNSNAETADTEPADEEEINPDEALEDETDEADEADEEPVLIDFTIQLTDEMGNMLEFPLSKCSPLQPMIKRKFTKLSLMQTANETESVMQHLYFPLNELNENGGKFNYENITGVKFIFDRTSTGVVAINNIGFITP